MDNTKTPKLMPITFAENGTRDEIQQDAGNYPNSATYSDGFPNVTSQPIAAGGIPPRRADFNGILNEITGNIRHQQAGAPYKFNEDFCNKIGGYPQGAILANNEFTNLFFSTANNNTCNFNTTPYDGFWKIFGGLSGFQNIEVVTQSTTKTITGERLFAIIVGGGAGGNSGLATIMGDTDATYKLHAGWRLTGGAGGLSGEWTAGFFELNGTKQVAITIGAGGTGGQTGPGENDWFGKRGTATTVTVDQKTVTANPGVGLLDIGAGNLFNLAGPVVAQGNQIQFQSQQAPVLVFTYNFCLGSCGGGPAGGVGVLSKTMTNTIPDGGPGKLGGGGGGGSAAILATSADDFTPVAIMTPGGNGGSGMVILFY